MLFYSFFKTMVGKEVAVELKNDLALTGKLHSVSEAHLPAWSLSPPPVSDTTRQLTFPLFSLRLPQLGGSIFEHQVDGGQRG